MSKKTLSYGSSGEEVKYLQKVLNEAGYSLDVDGKFGNKTQSAVKSYQKKNGLSVDGIVGVNTWGSLEKLNKNKQNINKNNNTSNSNSKNNITPPKEEKRPEYKKSDALISAEKSLEEWQNRKPSEYKSKYSDEIENILNSILNREKFSYNMNADPLYNQYKEQYMNNGKKAMLDTVANASALTGGYMNSYALSAGSQAYQDYLEDLNNVAIDLYDKAYKQYQDEESGLYDKANILYSTEKDDYEKYQNLLNNYYTEGDMLSESVSEISNSDYKQFVEALNAFENDRDYNYKKYLDKLEQQNFYDKLLAAQKEFEEEMAFKKAEAERDQRNKDRSYSLSASKQSSSKNKDASETTEKNKKTNKVSIKGYSNYPKSYQQFILMTGVTTILSENEFYLRTASVNKYGDYESYLKAMYDMYG